MTASDGQTLILRSVRGRIDYNLFNYCATCGYKLPKEILRCPDCRQKSEDEALAQAKGCGYKEALVVFYSSRISLTETDFNDNTMTSCMAQIQKKSMSKPDETRKFDKGKIDVTVVGDTSIGKATFEPGWKWSTSVKPIVKTNSCQVAHTMYLLSGQMKVKMDDGSEEEFGPGDTGIVPPGHDAWVVGNEPCVAIDFTGAKTYAK